MQKKNNYWIKSGLINLSGSVFSVLFSFFGFYFLVRVLNKTDYGIWTLFLTTTGLIETGRNGLTQEALIKFYAAATDQEKEKITSSVVFINVVITALISIFLLIVAPALSESWQSPVMIRMFSLFIIVFIISGFTAIFNCVEQASLSFKGTVYSGIMRQMIAFSYPFYCYFTNTQIDLIVLVYFQILGGVLAAIIVFFYSRRFFHFSWQIDYEWIKRILVFGAFTFGVTISAVLSSSIDQMMLGWMLSTAATGVFNVALRITNMTNIPTDAMTAIVYPQLSKRIVTEGQSSAKYLYERSVGVTLAILTPIVVFLYLFSGPVLHFIAGQKYDESLPLLKITLITCFIGPFARHSGTVFNSAGKTKLNFLLVIVSALLIIISNYFMIKALGIVGAALATLISSFLGILLAFYYLKKYFRINPFNSFIYMVKFYSEFYNSYVREYLNRFIKKS